MSVKIFISAVSDEFSDYRDQLRSDLTRHNVEVKVQEDFKDHGTVTLQKLDLYIRHCDAVVHLVGDMTGANAKPASTAAILAKYPDITQKLPSLRELLNQGAGISYTQWEAWLALYHGKALLLARADPIAARAPKFAPTNASRAAQQAHLQRLRDIERYPGFMFTSPDNLAKQIAYTTILDLLSKDEGGAGSPDIAISGDVNITTITHGLAADDVIRLVTLARSREATAHDQLTHLLKRHSPMVSNVAAEALENFFKIIGGKNESQERWPQRLKEIANRHVKLIERLAVITNDDPRVQERRLKASDAIKHGQYDSAQRLLEQAESIDEAAIAEQNELLSERMRSRATTLANLGDLEITRLNYREAARRFRQAATSIQNQAQHVEMFFGLVEREAQVWHSLGYEFGEVGALEKEVALRQWLVDQTDKKKFPFLWGTRQNSLGTSLQTLGARASGTRRLEEAISAYHKASKTCPRRRYPEQWAMIQNNLGNVFMNLADRERGIARLKAAVSAYRRALKILRPASNPKSWVVVQRGLGGALQTWGAREAGTERLRASARAYRAALKVATRRRSPMDWAALHNNLGNTLQSLGDREVSPKRLVESIGAYRNALKEWTRERVPLSWAAVQNNMAGAYNSLALRRQGDARRKLLEQSVDACLQALKERTRDRVPLDWATTQNGLGSALQALGAREKGTSRLKQAVRAYREALKVRTRRRTPYAWAFTQNNLGNALRTLGAREKGMTHLGQAISAYQKAQEEFTSERSPFDWAVTQFNMAIGFLTIGQRKFSRKDLEAAFKCVKAAADVYRQSSPHDFMQCMRLREQILAALVVGRNFPEPRLAKLATGRRKARGRPAHRVG